MPMRLDLSCPSLSAALSTSDPHVAALWLVSIFGSMADAEIRADVHVCINGVDRGARVWCRLTRWCEESIEAAIRKEAESINAAPTTLFAMKAA